VLDEDESDGIYEEEEEFGEYPPGKTSDPFQLSFWGDKLRQGGMFNLSYSQTCVNCAEHRPPVNNGQPKSSPANLNTNFVWATSKYRNNYLHEMPAFFGVPGVVVVHMFDRTKKWLCSTRTMSDKIFEDLVHYQI